MRTVQHLTVFFTIFASKYEYFLTCQDNCYLFNIVVGKLPIEKFQSLRGSNTQNKHNFKNKDKYILLRFVKPREEFDVEVHSFLTSGLTRCRKLGRFKPLRFTIWKSLLDTQCIERWMVPRFGKNYNTAFNDLCFEFKFFT